MKTIQKIKQVLGEPQRTIKDGKDTSLFWYTNSEIIVLLVRRRLKLVKGGKK